MTIVLEGSTARAVLLEAIRRLEEVGVPTARQDAEWLLADLLGIRRWALYLEPERPLPAQLLDRLAGLLARRSRGEPVQHLLGWEEFLGLTLRVNPGVLIPRPETELLVTWALEILRRSEGSCPRAVDLGTGSGAIACVLACELSDVTVVGVDVSRAALAVAAENVRTLGLERRVRLVQGDLFGPLKHVSADLVIANPPYIPSGDLDTLPVAVRKYEPRLALDGGPDGMAFHRRIVEAAPSYLRAGGWLLMECGDRQAGAIAEQLAAAGLGAIEVRRDLQGRNRMVGARSP